MNISKHGQVNLLYLSPKTALIWNTQMLLTWCLNKYKIKLFLTLLAKGQAATWDHISKPITTESSPVS